MIWCAWDQLYPGHGDRTVTACDPVVTFVLHAVSVRVLVVEDHGRLARALGNGLRREGMAVDVVFDGV